MRAVSVEGGHAWSGRDATMVPWPDVTWVARSAPLLLALLVAATARADGAQQAARAAYDRGVEAHKRGDLGRAAEEFARADALAPSPVALGAALDAAVAANQPVLGMELVARAARMSPPPATPPELKRSVEAARAAFAGKTGRVTVVCNEGAPCSATLDDQAIAPSVERVVLVGEHALVFRVGGSEEPRRVQVGPDAALEVHPSAAAVLAAPPSTPPAPGPGPGPAAPRPPAPAPVKREEPARAPQAGKPLPRFVIVLAGGLTVVAAGGAVWSGVVAGDLYDDFEAARCPDFAGVTCADLASRGSSAQTRANVLFATTGALGAATLAAALLWVDWDADGRKAASVRLAPQVGPSGGALGVSGTF